MFLLLLACCSARAQEGSLLLGPTAGGGVGAQFGSVPVYRGGPECGIFEEGWASGFWTGARLMLPSLFSEEFGLSLSGTWTRLSGSLSTLPVDEQTARDPGNGNLITLDREYRLDTRHSLLQIDLLATLSPGTGWRVMAGPWVGYQLSLSSALVDSIKGPGRNSFAGGERSRTISDGVVLTPATAAFGALLAVGYELPAGATTWIVPEISVRGTFSSPADDVSWRRLIAGGGVSVLFDLGSRVEIPPDTLDTIPPPPLLAASVRIEGVEENGEVVRIASVRLNEILNRSYTPILPAIFFESGDASISPRYINAVPGPKGSFGLEHAAARGAVDLHRFTLDIVGLRLRENPDATLELFGSASSGEASDLAVKRVEAVRGYLIESWNIDPARLRAGSGESPMRRSGEATEDGRIENRRVELLSSTAAILAPVVTDRITREFSPPLLRMIPTMQAEAGIRLWKMNITQGGSPVATYRSDDSTESEMKWRIAEEKIDSIPSPIAVELIVEDSTGAVIRARDEMPVSVDRLVNIVEQRGDGSVDRTAYALVAFGYNMPEPGAVDRQMLAEMIPTIKPGSEIRVTGFTDRIGGEEYNRDLSQRRAEQVAAMIRQLAATAGIPQINVIVEGGGIETERFSNDLPEGRILSRGVMVVVERKREQGGESQ